MSHWELTLQEGDDGEHGRYRSILSRQHTFRDANDPALVTENLNVFDCGALGGGDHSDTDLPPAFNTNSAQAGSFYQASPPNYSNDGVYEQLAELDDDELSPFDYAQRYGLIANDSQQLPVYASNLLPAPDEMIQDCEDHHGVLDIGRLLADETWEEINAPERWTVDKGVATILASVVALKDGYDDLEDIHRLSLMSLRLEEPLLPTDPDIDVWRLKRRNRATINRQRMQPFKLSDKRGESFAWSDVEVAFHLQVENMIEPEKLDIDVGVIRYLKENIMALASLSPEIPDVIAQVDCPVQLPKPCTPALLPLSPLTSSPRPSAVAMQMEYTSTPDDLVAQEASSLGQHIMQQDEMMSSSPLHTPHTSSSSPLHSKSIRNLKADVPLLAANDNMTSKLAKTVSFSEELHTLIPDAEVNATVSESNPESASNSSLVEAIGPLAEPAVRLIEQERLIEIDTTMRAVVPEVDKVILAPAWETTELDERSAITRKTTLARALGWVSNEEKVCRGLSKVERLLSWTPFPVRLGEVAVDESFDDGSFARYMAEIDLGGEIELDELIWKPDGLRILDEQEDDQDELKGWPLFPIGIPIEASLSRTSPEIPRLPAKLPSDRSEPKQANISSAMIDMQALLRKRKLELGASIGTTHRPNKLQSRAGTDSKQAHALDRGLVDSCKSADIGGLASFMHMQGRPIDVPMRPTEQTVPPQRSLASPANMIPSNKIIDDTATSGPVLIAPNAMDSQKSRCLVLTTEVAANRQLVSSILNQLPALALIERDPISPAGIQHRTCPEQLKLWEADVTLSPSTGLVLTTLQKLKQRSLPGQANFFGIQERIRHVAIRYERLIVLIGEARQQTHADDLVQLHALDDSDSAALSDLIALGAALSAESEVYYIAGGVSELARWVAAFISRHTPMGADSQLLAEETQWERSLRLAGLNAYAAQAILYQLKRPEPREAISSSATADSEIASYGIAAFVQMTAEQRLERFGQTMGGDKVLTRVNNTIDSQWLSAAR